MRSLEAAAPHARHVWRDSPAVNPDGTVNGYQKISRGDRRKFELDMSKNARAIDRMISERIGGYPVNYGFVPQTILMRRIPSTITVLGPSLPGGELVRGVIVGLMYMEDEKGYDAKVVLSPIGRDGRPTCELTLRSARRSQVISGSTGGQPGMFSKVPGWGSVADGRDHVATTRAFFRVSEARGIPVPGH